MEATLTFWETRDKKGLEPYIPPAIYDRVHVDGPYIDGVHKIICRLKEQGISLPEGLLSFPEKSLKPLSKSVPDVTRQDLQRVSLAVSFYKLLNQKYNLEFIEMKQVNDGFANQLFGSERVSNEARAILLENLIRLQVNAIDEEEEEEEKESEEDMSP